MSQGAEYIHMLTKNARSGFLILAVSFVPSSLASVKNGKKLFEVRRYVFPDEAAASASEEGRSSEYVVARSEEDALHEAQSRHAYTSHQHRLSCTAWT